MTGKMGKFIHTGMVHDFVMVGGRQQLSSCERAILVYRTCGIEEH